MDGRKKLDERLRQPAGGMFDARSTLHDFALINYAVAPEKVTVTIPDSRFEVMSFPTSAGPRAFFSAVLFLDVDFCFSRVAPFVKFKFYQTNHRAYVQDKQTGEPVVWFWGTNLGSSLVHWPRWLWKIPWHNTSYNVDCRFNLAARRYEKYSYHFQSDFCHGRAELRDTGEPLQALDGFSLLDEMKLILTQPVRGFYQRLDGQTGTYQIWHPEMNCTLGVADDLYFSLYERLGLLDAEQQRRPHSVFLCPQILFNVQLPPQLVGT